jgi:hypothetical protein
MAKKLTTEQFVEKAKLVHGDRYDYSKTVYGGSHKKVTIACKKHGIFEQLPINHCHKIQKQGCPVCGGCKKLTNESFILKAKSIHKNLYDYSEVRYLNNRKKVTIICPIHGRFQQSPGLHISKPNYCGCPTCAGTKKSNTSEFILKSEKIHGHTYDYKKSHYLNSHSKIKIICKRHGEFFQSATDHLTGRGCPVCRASKGELKIKHWLSTNGINFFSQHKFLDCKNPKTKYPLSYDFYIPSKNLLIEYDGEQHFKVGNYFGGYIKTKEQLSDLQFRDNIKTEYSINNEIPLLRINYKQFNKIEKILSSIL